MSMSSFNLPLYSTPRPCVLCAQKHVAFHLDRTLSKTHGVVVAMHGMYTRVRISSDDLNNTLISSTR
jgi:hypothetical protein